jgi:hypothetical protein
LSISRYFPAKRVSLVSGSERLGITEPKIRSSPRRP